VKMMIVESLSKKGTMLGLKGYTQLVKRLS
jgi:hypothetical protein